MEWPYHSLLLPPCTKIPRLSLVVFLPIANAAKHIGTGFSGRFYLHGQHFTLLFQYQIYFIACAVAEIVHAPGDALIVTVLSYFSNDPVFENGPVRRLELMPDSCLVLPPN